MTESVNVHEATSTPDLVPHRRVDLVFGAARGEISMSDDFDTVDDRVPAMFDGD